MKKTFAIVLSLCFLFGVASLSLAAMKQVTGKVAAVDQKAMTITVQGKKGEVTASVDQKTRVMEGKEKKTLADVQVGDKVTLKYSKADGKDIAKRIEIKKAVPAKEEAPAMKEAAPAKKEAPAKAAPKAPGY
jgi:divalent metal cation (Fe/Co/Zn/Cd) transporter